MIHYVSPWRAGDIGGALNEAIAPLPDDAWICVRDGDTLFLAPDWGTQVESIVEVHGDEFGLIGCMTNRLRAPYQLHGGKISDEPSIEVHRRIADEHWRAFGPTVQPLRAGPVAGMLMLFPRALWAGQPFVPRSRYFDQEFTAAARLKGVQVGIAQGLYLFHLYRWGQPRPTEYVKHLEAAGL